MKREGPLYPRQASLGGARRGEDGRYEARRDRRLKQPVDVHFVYGLGDGEFYRPSRGTLGWGWIAQANAGHIASGEA